MTVYIADDVWQKIVEEADYFGKDDIEASLYLMFWFAKKQTFPKPPWAKIEIEDIEYFAVTHGFVIPRVLCSHETGRIGYRYDDAASKEEIDRMVNSWSKRLVKKHQTLEVAGIHSHPFSQGRTWPSGIDYNIMREYKLNQRRCLAAVPTLILCRSNDEKEKWKACCFTFDRFEKVLFLGYAEIIPANDQKIRRVLSKSFHEKPSGYFWENRQKKMTGFIEIEKSFFGWHIFKTRLGSSIALFVYLPPDFPDCGNVTYQTYDLVGKTWSDIRFYPKGSGLFGFDIAEIVKTTDNVENTGEEIIR